MSALPPLRVDPGWYWWLQMPQDAREFATFSSAQRGALRVRMVYRGQNETSEILVFQVLQTIAWTLSTPPVRAPKGARTRLDDIISGPAPQPHWTVALQDFADAPGKKIGEASSALSLVLWGGAAILLFNLYRRTKAPPELAEESAA
jgi:hypothetical protein